MWRNTAYRINVLYGVIARYPLCRQNSYTVRSLSMLQRVMVAACSVIGFVELMKPRVFHQRVIHQRVIHLHRSSIIICCKLNDHAFAQTLTIYRHLDIELSYYWCFRASIKLSIVSRAKQNLLILLYPSFDNAK